MMAAVYIAFVNSLSNIYYSIFLALTMYIFIVVYQSCSKANRLDAHQGMIGRDVYDRLDRTAKRQHGVVLFLNGFMCQILGMGVGRLW